MTIHRSLLAGSLGLALLLAACGGSTATQAPAASPTSPAVQPTAAAPSEAAGESAEPTEEPTEQATDDNGTEPSFVPGAAGDLEAMLPSEVNGVKFLKTSFDGSSLGVAGMGVNAGDLDPLLKKYGKTVNDVRVAIASPADTASGVTAMVLALQVKGVPANELIKATGQDTASLTKQNIGGKDVLSAGAGAFNIAIYTKDDVVFEVLLGDAAMTEAIVKALP